MDDETGATYYVTFWDCRGVTGCGMTRIPGTLAKCPMWSGRPLPDRTVKAAVAFLAPSQSDVTALYFPAKLAAYQ